MALAQTLAKASAQGLPGCCHGLSQGLGQGLGPDLGQGHGLGPGLGQGLGRGLVKPSGPRAVQGLCCFSKYSRHTLDSFAKAHFHAYSLATHLGASELITPPFEGIIRRFLIGCSTQ